MYLTKNNFIFISEILGHVFYNGPVKNQAAIAPYVLSSS
jgi:uncharacterized protein (DUF2164 family)